ncbi:hypothetical protein ATANTOWER_026648 [Ataeniobius toweri]|uniref:Uncharacterized protein n=1 Tax=Ataeniobius toweri TaxID=208326 RepID=A0ABU7ATJ0_9TELE|nr:hypothetical protein [Ataeniobius toweri]
MPSSLTMARTAADVFRISRYAKPPTPKSRNPVIKNPIVYTSSTSSSGQEAFPFTLSSRRENLINCIERPADQFHTSEFWKICKKRLQKERQDTELKQGRYGWLRETEKSVLLHREQKEKRSSLLQPLH